MPITQEKRQAFAQVVQRMITDNVDPQLIREATAKFKQKYDTDSTQITPEPQPKNVYDNSTKIDYPMSYGALPPDVKMSVTPEMQRDAGQFIKPAKFLGDVGTLATTGIPNAIAQAVQDKGFAPWQATKNVGKAILTPAANLIGTPFQNPIQDSRKSLARAGVPDGDRTIYGTSDAELFGGMTGGVTAKGSQGQQLRGQGIESAGPAEMLGTFADYATPVLPVVSIDAVKAMGAASRAGLSKIIDPVGAGLQNIAVGQSKSITPFLSRHVRQGADHETFFKENLMGPKDEIFQKAKDLKKELGEKQGEIIRQGRDEGVRINGLEEIDKLLAPHLENPGASQQGARLTDPASQKFINKAKTFITRLSKEKDGVLDLQQAQTVKQWLQKQAEYTGPADAAGVPLVAAPNEAALTAADLGHQFRKTIEDVAPPELAEINKRLNKLYPNERAAGWRQMIRDRQPPVSLKDFVGIGQIVTSPLWVASKIYGSGRVANAIYKLGTKLRTAKTPEEAQKIVSSLKKIGMETDDIHSALAISKSKDPPKSEDELSSLFESLKFGKPKQPAPVDPELAGWDALAPQNRANQPTGGGGSIEDLYPPEAIVRKADEARASNEAFIRQGRELRPSKPFEPPQQPNFRVIERPPAKPKTQKDLFGPQDMRIRVQEMRKYLEATTKKTPFTGEVMRELEKLGKKPVPKVPVKEKAAFKPRPKRNNFDLDGEEELFLSGHESWPTDKVKAEDAPKTFLVGQREYTKGRTLYGKTTFKDDKGRKFEVKNEDFVHMDKKQDEVPF